MGASCMTSAERTRRYRQRRKRDVVIVPGEVTNEVAEALVSDGWLSHEDGMVTRVGLSKALGEFIGVWSESIIK